MGKKRGKKKTNVFKISCYYYCYTLCLKKKKKKIKRRRSGRPHTPQRTRSNSELPESTEAKKKKAIKKNKKNSDIRIREKKKCFPPRGEVKNRHTN